jgi:two-component system sensor histidine kinase KdpD
MSAMVNDLLDMTRLLAGRVALDRQWYPLEELVGAAIERCKSRLVEHHVRTRIDPKLPMVHVDGVLIDKLLVNLLENAAKYTPPGSPLEVSVERRGEQAVLEVADRGPGLPPGAEARVFERFYRAADSHRSRGTGLGLTVSEAIVRAHHGRIEAENRPGGGALFRVSLPLADDGAESAAGGRTP